MAKIPTGQKVQTVSSSVPTIEKKSALTNAGVEVYTIDDFRETIMGTPDEILYTEVAVPGNELIAIGSTPKVLLDASALLNSNQYFDYRYKIEANQPADLNEKVVLVGDFFMVGELTNYSGDLVDPSLMLLGGGAKTTIFEGTGNSAIKYDTTTVPAFPANIKIPRPINTDVVLTTWNSTNPSVAGTPAVPGEPTANFIIKIWYKVRTLGSEL